MLFYRKALKEKQVLRLRDKNRSHEPGIVANAVWFLSMLSHSVSKDSTAC